MKTASLSIIVLTGFSSLLMAEESTRKLEPNLALDLGDGVTLEMILIRPGAFTMGHDDDRDAKPAHRVVIAKPYYLGKFEVTQEQWKAAMGSAHAATTTRDPKRPVDTVEWWEAERFCEKLRERFPGRGFRLPTEPEWEYACRAGSNTKYSFGDDAAGLVDYAWFRRDGDRTPNPKVQGVADTQPVGGKKPNAWGLHDMHGNVWEWCHTNWSTYPYKGDDGREVPPPKSNNPDKNPKLLLDAHVLRGGSWHHGAKASTSYSRAAARAADHRYYYGCRVALTPPE